MASRKAHRASFSLVTLASHLPTIAEPGRPGLLSPCPARTPPQSRDGYDKPPALAAAARSPSRVRRARPAARGGAFGAESGAGPTRRGGGGQDRAVGPPRGERVGVSHRAGGGRGVRDGARLRRRAPGLRADARPPHAPAGPPARGGR